MARWAGKEIRKQREEIIIMRYREGWLAKTIAGYIGISLGSVSRVIKIHRRRGVLNENSAN